MRAWIAASLIVLSAGLFVPPVDPRLRTGGRSGSPNPKRPPLFSLFVDQNGRRRLGVGAIASYVRVSQTAGAYVVTNGRQPRFNQNVLAMTDALVVSNEDTDAPWA